MSVRPEDVREQLGRILDEESGQLQSLERLMLEEGVILQDDDPDEITRISAQRHECVLSLTRLEAERTAAARMLSFGNDPGAVEKLIAWSDDDGSLRRRFAANLEIARRCKSLNDRNGAVVSLKLNRVQTLLATLRGSGPTPVYARQGLRLAAVGARDLGSA